MKKLAIVGTSVALAALPVVGAFAFDDADGHVDVISVTVEAVCSITTTGEVLSPASTYKTMIFDGDVDTNIVGSTFTVACNDTGGWEMHAVGSGKGSTVAVMDASTGPDDDIATGTNFDGTVSNWAFKVSGTDGANIVGGYDSFSKIPVTEAKIADGPAFTKAAKISTTYGVGISPTQEPGTYTGKVTYRLVHPATN